MTEIPSNKKSVSLFSEQKKKAAEEAEVVEDFGKLKVSTQPNHTDSTLPQKSAGFPLLHP
jgi:hypothetical protein